MGLGSRKGKQAHHTRFRRAQGSCLGTYERTAMWAEKGKMKPTRPRGNVNSGHPAQWWGVNMPTLSVFERGSTFSFATIPSKMTILRPRTSQTRSTEEGELMDDNQKEQKTQSLIWWRNRRRTWRNRGHPPYSLIDNANVEIEGIRSLGPISVTKIFPKLSKLTGWRLCQLRSCQLW